MPKYQAEVLVEIEDDGDEEAAFERIDSIMQQHHNQTGETLGWHFTMLEDCVRNLTEEADAAAEKAVCRHCGRGIVNNPDDGWVDPEAGYDMDGDGIWREVCDRHETFNAVHEPQEAS